MGVRVCLCACAHARVLAVINRRRVAARNLSRRPPCRSLPPSTPANSVSSFRHVPLGYVLPLRCLHPLSPGPTDGPPLRRGWDPVSRRECCSQLLKRSEWRGTNKTERDEGHRRRNDRTWRFAFVLHKIVSVCSVRLVGGLFPAVRMT